MFTLDVQATWRNPGWLIGDFVLRTVLITEMKAYLYMALAMVTNCFSAYICTYFRYFLDSAMVCGAKYPGPRTKCQISINHA